MGGIRKRPPLASSEHEIEVITQTAATLARKKTGALIVLQGTEPLERHIQEGIRLDGILSEPLLESIFDPHSMGHDGAVLIDRGKIVQFGIHLPLSSNSREFGNLGLRHTAALGLAERSDALCIVVSEERGSISVAHNGELRIFDNAAKLKIELDRFYADQSPAEKKSSFSWVGKNIFEKSVAVVIALIIWIALGYQRETVQRDFVVPIEYRNIPAEWVIDEPKIVDAKVMIMGAEQAFRLFDPSGLKISLDLSTIRQGGQELALNKEMVKSPSNLNVVGIKPERIHITAYKLISTTVPIEVKTVGTLPARHRAPKNRYIAFLCFSPCAAKNPQKRTESEYKAYRSTGYKLEHIDHDRNNPARGNPFCRFKATGYRCQYKGQEPRLRLPGTESGKR